MPLKQRLTFTLIMCIGMGSIMSLLGMVTSSGWSNALVHQFAASVVPTIVFAFIFNLLIASNIAAALIKFGTRNLTDNQAIIHRASTIRG